MFVLLIKLRVAEQTSLCILLRKQGVAEQLAQGHKNAEYNGSSRADILGVLVIFRYMPGCHAVYRLMGVAEQIIF